MASRHRMEIAPTKMLHTALTTKHDSLISKFWIALGKSLLRQRTKDSSIAWHRITALSGHMENHLQTLITGYQFLVYASQRWLMHSSQLRQEQGNIAWRLFEKLFTSGNVFATRPLSLDNWDKLDISVSQFIVQHDHKALFQLFMKTLSCHPENESGATWKALLRTIVPSGSYQHFLAFLHSFHQLESKAISELKPGNLFDLALEGDQIEIAACLLRYHSHITQGVLGKYPISPN